jgi:DNA (cytosine-5)-methyltransferase 1
MSRVRTPLSKIEDYPAYLEKCWNEHLQEKSDNAPTVISTFAGCGGSSLGYSMAGFRELLAVEWDDNAVETFKLNFPDITVYHGDIAKISVEQVLEMTRLKPGKLDVFDASPPCQGFSVQGKRRFADSRNQLFQEFVRLLRGLQPKVFVMENVPGMVRGKMKLIFAEILSELKQSGYDVTAKILNTMYFGVPQSRQRLIFIGVREDLGIEPSHPEAENVPVVCSQCNYESGKRLLGVELERWKNIPPGGNWKNLPNHLVNGKAKFSNFHRKLNGDSPSYTIGKTEHLSSGRFYHWSEPRRINDVELSRIGGFPNDFTFVGNSKVVHERIGNSVPPLFMRSIAKHIRSEILSHSRKLSEG